MIRLFRVFVPTSVLALIVSEIVLVFSCFILGTALVIDTDLEIFFLYDGGIEKILLVVASVMLGLYFQDFYTDFRIASKSVLFQQLCLVIGMVFFSQALLTYVNVHLMMSRWIMIYGCGLILVLLPAWRIAYTSVVFRALGAQRLLFLGTNAIAVNIAERMVERPELGFVNLGYVDDKRETGEELAGAKVLGGLSSLRDIVERCAPDRIVVGLTERRQQLPVYDLLDMRFGGIRIEEAAVTYEAAFGRVSTLELRPSQLIFSAELGPQKQSLTIQLLYSTLLGFVGVVMALPVMLLVALAVRLTSAGPILFKQKRVGLNGKNFMVYKFRSMRIDAEAKTGAVWATRDDPRVTPIGKWLRRLRLDELPQLFNVLKGEMSIVGPRPERPEFVNTLSEQIPFYRQRHCVRPGITGWAQINYKYGETIEDTIIKLEYDLYYIKNLSPSLDMYIIFHTAKVMLFSQSGQ
jgi:sugar transferase (PEP-CTERM system associated)